MAQKSVILFLDTQDSEKTSVELDVNGHKTSRTVQSGKARSQAILPLIEDILKNQKLKFSDIAQIYLATGPGSFTGLRVGAAVAQVLGVLLGVPVNDLPPGSSIKLVYGSNKY